MRTFTVRCSALMTVMMVAVLCSASVHNCTEKNLCDHLLKRIKAEAKNLTNLHKQVPKLPGHGKCQRDFFCLAEKVLENITHVRHVRNTTPEKIPPKDKFETLKKLLKKYNEKTKETNCNLSTTITYSLKTFLNRVETCADHAYNHTR